ncbi:MAG: hypothetical protein FH756_00490 [Firmicutes bacterium]|nr:hypothetical protein [Bacillota bacterium]
MEFILRLKKTTKCKACFKENMDRIGRIYLSIQAVEELNIGDEILVQLAPNKTFFANSYENSYITQVVWDKETAKKVRFAEDINEKGELGVIYIGKKILESLGVDDKVAVRITQPGKTGGVTAAEG